MTPQKFSQLLSLVGPSITRQDTHLCKAITPGERLAITIRYLVTGDSMKTIYLSAIEGRHSTVGGIIDGTCDAIWSVLMPEYMRRSRSAEEWRQVSEGFEHTWNFPHCVGAIDGKHVVMQAPSHSCSTFFNYKGTHSIILMAVCECPVLFHRSGHW